MSINNTSFIDSMQKSHKNILIIYLVSLVSKICYLISHVPFAQDQVRDVLFIRGLIEHSNFFIPFGPATSVGSFFLPPLYYYLHLLSQIVFLKNFYSMDILVLILESFTPVIIFLLTYKITKHTRTSFGASLIYLFSFGVLSASNAWNPNLVPLFSTLFIFGFLSYVLEKNRFWLTTALLSFSVLLHLHFQWFLLAPLFVVLLGYALKHYKQTWKHLVIYTLLTILMFAPYAISELESGFTNTQQAVELLSSESKVYERVRKPAYLAVFFPNYYQRILVGNMFVQSWDRQYEIMQAPLVVGSLLFFLIFTLNFYIAVQKYRNEKNPYLLGYLGIFIFIFFFLRVYSGDKPDYYIYVVISYASVLLSVAFWHLTKQRRRFVQILPFALILAVQAAAIMSIPHRNSYSAYQTIANQANILSQNYSLFVEPVHQELVTPLRYFLEDEYFDSTQKDTVQYYALVCYALQDCQNYVVNEGNQNNVFKYDHTTPVDFSYNWSTYSPELQKDSFVITSGHLTAYFLRVSNE